MTAPHAHATSTTPPQPTRATSPKKVNRLTPAQAARTPVIPQARPVNIQIDQLMVDGCGPVSPHTLREGFRATLAAEHNALEAIAHHPELLSEALSQPLDLTLSQAPNGYSIGQSLARKIIQLAQAR